MIKVPKKTARKVKLGALSVAILVAGILVTFSLPKSVNLAQTSAFSSNQPNNKVIDTSRPQVAGISAKTIAPTSKNINPPQLSAAGVLIQDVHSGVVLYQKDSHNRLPIASTTKIMTALVGSEYYKANSVLTVTPSSLVDGSTMGLKLGEQLSFRSILYGLMLNSGNDAAFTIAANYPGGVPAFIDAMNQRAAVLQLTDTHFDNPAGFDSSNHYSSAADLAKIAVVAEGNSQIARVVSTKETEVASLDKSVIHNLKNLNKLLELPGVLGMKTGYTPAAKENLVTLVDRDDHKIILVVLGSDDRFGESKQLIDWVYSNFSW